MIKHEQINYIEMASNDLIKTRVFFEKVFSWTFTKFSDEYISFYNEGIDGDIKKRVEEDGGIINKDIFSFHGGKRFHFIEPGGNEFAIWQKDA